MSNLVRETLSRHRRQHDLSQLGLAKQIGISSGQLAALEAGRDVPSLYNLKKLAKFFGWTPEAIGKYVIACKAEPTGPKRLRVE